MSFPTFQIIPAGAYVSMHSSEEITADIQGPNGHGVQFQDEELPF
jgi:hypothetical protein